MGPDADVEEKVLDFKVHGKRIMADKSGACSLEWVPNLFLEIKTELPGTKGKNFDTLILGNLTRI